ncbi:hypothetical protein KC930_01375 [Candidatus Saccharibacteria bacterium]|nr:hypothetical protein [Candidatus Saccharibacteria bacterium]
MAKKKQNSSTAYSTSLKVWAVVRIMIGLIMLWAFADKMLGLGFSTCRSTDTKTKVETVQVLCEKSVAKGASPTVGFLKFAAKGPMKSFYNNLAGKHWVDFMFMAALLLGGLALVSGVGVRIASVGSILLLVMMWSVVLPVAQNPVLDDHLVYAVALLGVMATNADQVWGLGKWWQKQAVVKKYPILQ